MVKQNSGFINVYSEPGQGTTFKIYIPSVGEEEIRTEEAEEAQVAYGSGKVLLVEDEEMVREIAKEILEEIGYTVLVAETPREALSL
jgi:two-component system, cell cycle sensor histidine kinase and response regulator CckA